jgi:hypothetical protein
MGIGGAGLTDGLVVVPLVAFIFLGAIKLAKKHARSQCNLLEFFTLRSSSNLIHKNSG